MKHQMLSILTGLSVALAPMAAFAGKNEGGGPPKNNCDPEMVDRLWRSDNTKLKEDFQKYYLTKKSKRTMTEEEFCDQFNTEAGTCADGDCNKSKHNPPVDPDNAQDIRHATEQNVDDGPVPPRYRGDEPRVVEKVVYRDRPAPAGGGGDLFNGNPMGYMLAGGLGGLIGAMLAGGNNNNNMMMRPPMFRAPYGPYGPMGPGGMMGNRPPPYMPYNRAGAAPGIIGAGGGAFAPGVISPYNGATIYNGGYMGSGVGGYGSTYFQTPPAVINATTGMRMYSVGGAAPATQYHLLGK
jgi:hypothetical protein